MYIYIYIEIYIYIYMHARVMARLSGPMESPILGPHVPQLSPRPQAGHPVTKAPRPSPQAMD